VRTAVGPGLSATEALTGKTCGGVQRRRLKQLKPRKPVAGHSTETLRLDNPR
jgi:hypothetical protein